jgi:iron complex transport system ATP-binding protein
MTAALLQATGLHVTLGRAGVLDGVDLGVEAGQIVGLLGPNGAGKTTLLRALAGLQPLAAGAVTLDGQPLSEIDAKARARLLAYLPQNGECHWAVSVETLVATGRLPHQRAWAHPGERDRAAVRRAMEACNVEGFARRRIGQLSGGERARVLLARALAVEPRLLLADEPVAGLDPAHQLDVMESFARLKADGVAVVIVVHDLSLAARYCDRLVLLHGGRVMAEGAAEAVLTPANLARGYGIEARYARIDGQPCIVPLARTSDLAEQG